MKGSVGDQWGASGAQVGGLGYLEPGAGGHCVVGPPRSRPSGQRGHRVRLEHKCERDPPSQARHQVGLPGKVLGLDAPPHLDGLAAELGEGPGQLDREPLGGVAAVDGDQREVGEVGCLQVYPSSMC